MQGPHTHTRRLRQEDPKSEVSWSYTDPGQHRLHKETCLKTQRQNSMKQERKTWEKGEEGGRETVNKKGKN